MRKASYIFLALGILTPFVTEIFVRREAAEYRARFGFDPEGIGLFGMTAMGAAFMFLFFLLSAIFATRAYRLLIQPRPLLRRVELAALWLPLGLTLISICLFLLGNMIFTAPQVIQNE